MELEIFRGTERLLIVLIGGMSIFLGWDLFRKGVITPADGVFEGKGWKFTLQKAGPGIFFAFFGASICVNSTLNGLHESANSAQASNESNSNKETYYFAGSKLSTLDVVQAINTLKLIKLDDEKYYRHETKALKESQSILSQYNDFLIHSKFSPDEIDQYITIKNSSTNNHNKAEEKLIGELGPYYENLDQ